MSPIKLMIPLLVASLLSSCGTTPKQVREQRVTAPVEALPSRQSLTAEEFIARARVSTSELRNLWLLKAAESWQTDHCEKSVKLLTALLPELSNNMELTQANLILAECYLRLSKLDEAELLMPKLALQVGFDQRIYRVQAQVFEHKKKWLAAATAEFNIQQPQNDRLEKTWRLMSHVSISELENGFVRYSQLQPMLQLAVISRKHGTQPSELEQQVSQWQQRFPEFAEHLPQQIAAAISTPISPTSKVAVLLPLSGNLASQAKAIKDGILASYFESADESISLEFFDTGINTMEQLNALVTEHDFIVGPLRKENITEITGLLPPGKPMLALNNIGVTEADTGRYFFSLAPEDEAIQIAQHLTTKGFNQIAVISSGSNNAKRMTTAFLNEFRSEDVNNSVNAELFTFTNNKSMRNGVSKLLSVDQSAKRINQIEKMLGKDVIPFPRNRRDIQAIVIFANAAESELLNPIIESSISPFASIVPVFASSRSYSLQMKENGLRDLSNLSFVDMPWMLNAKHWSKVNTSINTLWPNRNDRLQRLFAMGYDAYDLVPKLTHMQLLPQIEQQGMTGKLSLDAQGNITRKLMWGQIQRDGVTPLELD